METASCSMVLKTLAAHSKLEESTYPNLLSARMSLNNVDRMCTLI